MSLLPPGADRLFVVDRIEGRGAGARVVMIADDGEELEVEVRAFGRNALVAEGQVLRIGTTTEALDWRTARRDPAEEARRRLDAGAKMGRLRKKDPGGDLDL